MTMFRLRHPGVLAARALIVLALLAVGAPAQADLITDGTLNFSASIGSPTPTGSFVYDDTTNSVISYTLNWDGATYDLTTPLRFLSPSITTLIQPGNWCAAAQTSISCTNIFPNVSIDDEFVFHIPNNTFFTHPPIPNFQYISNNASALGSFTVTTAVSTPEPSALALLGAALAGLFLFRSRAHRRDRRARADLADSGAPA